MEKNKNESAKVTPEFTINVTARDKDGSILGKGKSYAYTENEEGHAAATKRYRHVGIITLVNRQLKTDRRNELARPEGDMIKTKCKVMLSMIEKNEALKEVFIKEVETWIHLSSEVRSNVVEILKAA